MATKFDAVDLCCAHCGVTFRATKPQAIHVHYNGQRAFCAPACRYARAAEERRARVPPLPLRGPCRRCGVLFPSKRDKPYCTLGCYTASDQFAAHTRAIQKTSYTPESKAKAFATRRLNNGIEAETPCEHCGANFPFKSGKRFCGKPCSRAFMAARFDRWIANPQAMALPQAYDEFLTGDVLPCLVEGCGWSGRHLSLHANLAHGIPAADLKRAGGFNLNSGLVCDDLARKLRERPGTVERLETARVALAASVATPTPRTDYASLEGAEHRKKAMALTCTQPGPERTCRGCGVLFPQRTMNGRTLFHSKACRQAAYLAKLRSGAIKTRDALGRFVWQEPS